MSCSCFGTSSSLQKKHDKRANEPTQDEGGKYLISLLHVKALFWLFSVGLRSSVYNKIGTMQVPMLNEDI